MELGAFSVSLAVKDMAASRDFYAKLGFVMIAGDGETFAQTTDPFESPKQVDRRRTRGSECGAVPSKICQGRGGIGSGGGCPFPSKHQTVGGCHADGRRAAYR